MSGMPKGIVFYIVFFIKGCLLRTASELRIFTAFLVPGKNIDLGKFKACLMRSFPSLVWYGNFFLKKRPASHTQNSFLKGGPVIFLSKSRFVATIDSAGPPRPPPSLSGMYPAQAYQFKNQPRK